MDARSDVERQVVDLLKSLIATPSENPNGCEEATAKLLHEYLNDNGIAATLTWPAKGRPNVFAACAGSKQGETVLLNGHLDTVPAGDGWTADPFAAEVKNGKLYGRGASDMKGGVAAMAVAAVQLHRAGNPFAGSLQLFFNSDEERTNIGMRHFVDNPVPFDYAVIGEPSDVDICVGHRGVARFTATTQGTPGHTAIVQKPDNAIYKMIPVVQKLAAMDAPLRSRNHELLGQSSLTVSEMHGGTAPNVVPESCTIQVDRRTLPGETREQVVSQVQEQLAFVESDCALDCYLFIPATFLNEDHILVQAMKESITAVRDAAPKIKGFEATCEAPFLSVDLDKPTIVMGPGSLNLAHVSDEYVLVNELADATLSYIDFVPRLLGRA